jgi:hypothetical protein
MFEKFGPKPEKKKEGIYDRNSNVPKIVGLAGLIALGGAVADEVYEHNPDHIKFEQELSAEKSRAEGYHYSSEVKKDTLKFLSDDFINEVALNTKNDQNTYLFELRNSLLKAKDKIELENKDNKDIEEMLSSCNLRINEQENQLDNNDKLVSKRKIIKIMTLIENVKIKLIHHVGSEEYLDKLAKEMNISKKAAKEHQKVRVDNIDNISYDLKSPARISIETGEEGYAYYDKEKHQISLPYNINIENENDIDYFYKALEQEILHSSTESNKGLSDHLKKSLKEAFSYKKDEDVESNFYFSIPAELIARKQILDLEMEELGIKKYGDVFTKEHYEKLLILKKEGKLSEASSELIDHIKSEEFPKIMNELAENTNDNSTNKTYQHPEWDYGDMA